MGVLFRFAGLGLVGFLALAVWIYCAFDVIASEEVLVRRRKDRDDGPAPG